MENVRLAVGQIVGAHGVSGEMKVALWTDEPDALPAVRWFYFGEETTPRRVMGFRRHGRQALIRFKGVTTPEQASTLRGTVLRVSGRDLRPLAPGEYFHYQIIGLPVVAEAGEPVGVVADLIETGANDVLVVTPREDGPDILLPNIPDVVLSIDPVVGRIVVRLPRYYDEA